MNNVGAFLKDERGSEADQRVIKEVIELSNKASKSYDDFNLVLKEPNFLEKFLLKLMSGGKRSRTDKIQQSAITNFKLLIELQKSCEAWLEMLKDSMGKITESTVSDVDNVTILEKYIVAGYIAKERIEQELDDYKAKYDESGLQADAQRYNELKEGYDIFIRVLDSLEKSRAVYCLSIGQLALTQRSNRNLQMSIHTQMKNSMTLLGTEIRNAVLNAKNQEVLEGQQALSRLNDEVMKEVSKDIVLTAEQSEKLLYRGFYSVDAAKQAITQVINGCDTIQKTAEEMLPKMYAETEELNQLIKELEPHVNKVKQNVANLDSGTTNKLPPKTNQLKF